MHELITKQIQFSCDLDECACFSRLNRVREEEEKMHCLDVIVLRDLLDSIHCFLLHSFDSGLKIKHKTSQLITSAAEESDNENVRYFDVVLHALKQHLFSHKKRLLKLRGHKRFNHSRFICNALR